MRLMLVLLLLSFPALGQEPALPQDDTLLPTPEVTAEAETTNVRPVRTASPRLTLESLLRLRDEVEDALIDYRSDKGFEKAARIVFLTDQILSLMDLSAVPPSSRRETGIETALALLDIVGRVDLPPLDDVPDSEAFEDDGPAQWRIPDTPLRIVRIEDGPRQEEFLFSQRTTSVAPRFFVGIEDLPLESKLNIESWTRALPQLTGPWIPTWVLQKIPRDLLPLWLDTPLWKVLAVALMSLATLVGLVLWHRIVVALQPKTIFLSIAVRTLSPLGVLTAIYFLRYFFNRQINTSGAFSEWIDVATVVAFYLAAVWLFWLVVTGLAEWLIRSPKIPDQSLNANLLRIGARIAGIIGGLIILGIGGSQLGLPVFSIIAGLGIGGLAVALAIRPTLENLIGGVVLYLDKPVRVGDFCSFLGHTGTVETIGVRSTQIRTVDRTLISVPNAKFADMEIINWARCDQMLIQEKIGLRYETSPDQLRLVLAKVRRMFHAHPRIDSDTIRVRFSGYGDFSLDFTVRVYALTREWNDYFAIKEDVLMRLYTIIEDAGTGFAFPSQTLYMGQDSGLDADRTKTATDEVARWRRAGMLPFPRMSKDEIERLNDTLDYPPRGSVDAGRPEAFDTENLEGLSSASKPVEPEAMPENLAADVDPPDKAKV